MSGDPITPAVSDRICAHMNDDHADAVLLYAKVFGHSPAATAAELDSIDPEGMTLTAQVNGASVPMRIPFEHPLADSEDAHQTLIAMIKQARQQP
jgi:putative heme iron utilization protein